MLGLASVFTYGQKPWDNGKLMVSSNNRYLQFENGRPFFWLGDTGWLVPQHLDRSEVEYYFNKCRRAGYNMVQIQVMDAVPSYNIYGQQSLPYGWDFTKADPEGVYSYWDHLDYIVRKAEQNGIYIGMVAIWGSQVQAGNINAEQAKAYGKFLAERYKNNPNIIWIIGGDIQGNIHPEVWDALATSIKSIDNKHLMTFHPRGRYTSAKWWSKASWMDFHTFQSGHRKYGQRMGNKDYPIPDSTEEDNWMYVDSTWAYKPIKPVLDDEPSYEDIPKGLHDANGESIVPPIFKSERAVYYGDVSSHLANLVVKKLGVKARSEKPGLCGRASVALQSPVDREEARQAGTVALRSAVEGNSGVMVGFERVPGTVYQMKTKLVPIKEVMLYERKMPDNFINERGNDVTQEFVDWCRPLIGDPLPEFLNFKDYL